MNNFIINYDELKLDALEKAISHLPYSSMIEENILEVNNMSDINEITRALEDNKELDVHKDGDMIIVDELLRMLLSNQARFKYSSKNELNFFRNGLHILTIKQKELDTEQKKSTRRINVLIKAYLEQLEAYVAEKKIYRGLSVGVGSAVVLGGLYGILAWLRRD